MGCIKMTRTRKTELFQIYLESMVKGNIGKEVACYKENSSMGWAFRLKDSFRLGV